jgi:Zn-dependent peptidase ImmA (M78 family)/transcriptional regulator with XRE-family HTH domain
MFGQVHSVDEKKPQTQLTPATLGRRLREARTNCGLTQEAAADALGMPRTALVGIEAGTRSVSTIELLAFARLYSRDTQFFLAEDQEETPLVALCRLQPKLVGARDARESISRHLDICREGVQVERLLDERAPALPPAYDLPEPGDWDEAVEQGQELAVQERKRLNLGDAPIADMAGLIAGQGIWTAAARLPDEFSGLFLHHSTVGIVILVNSSHPRARRRFSWAHEYAHALLDRKRTAAVSGRHNSDELVERRANAFAGAFLIPASGVEAVLDRLNKGGGSRRSFLIYDVARDQLSHGAKRNPPGSQTIAIQDVALLAHEFIVSFQAAAYRLSDLNFISRVVLDELLARQSDSTAFLQALKLRDPEASPDGPRDTEQPKLASQIGRLAAEALRRKLIPAEKFLELCATVDIPGERLLKVIQSTRG